MGASPVIDEIRHVRREEPVPNPAALHQMLNFH
jgi:hypothetical protein